MRQVIAPAGASGDDTALYAGVAIGHGKVARGAVIGHVQLLACNYGEVCQATLVKMVRVPAYDSDDFQTLLQAGRGGATVSAGIPAEITRPVGPNGVFEDSLRWKSGRVGEYCQQRSSTETRSSVSSLSLLGIFLG